MPHLPNKSCRWFLVVETLSSGSGGSIGTIPLLVYEAGEEAT
jgi:hypothetical protein